MGGLLQKFLTDFGKIVVDLALQLSQFLLLLFLLFQQPRCFYNGPGNLLCGIGLDHKIYYFILNGSLSIREVSEGCKDDDLDLRKVLVYIIR
ncbi:hypothetical protein D3C74_406510 [compost metagenome]